MFPAGLLISADIRIMGAAMRPLWGSAAEDHKHLSSSSNAMKVRPDR